MIKEKEQRGVRILRILHHRDSLREKHLGTGANEREKPLTGSPSTQTLETELYKADSELGKARFYLKIFEREKAEMTKIRESTDRISLSGVAFQNYRRLYEKLESMPDEDASLKQGVTRIEDIKRKEKQRQKKVKTTTVFKHEKPTETTGEEGGNGNPEKLLKLLQELPPGYYYLSDQLLKHFFPDDDEKKGRSNLGNLLPKVKKISQREIGTVSVREPGKKGRPKSGYYLKRPGQKLIPSMQYQPELDEVELFKKEEEAKPPVTAEEAPLPPPHIPEELKPKPKISPLEKRFPGIRKSLNNLFDRVKKVNKFPKRASPAQVAHAFGPLNIKAIREYADAKYVRSKSGKKLLYGAVQIASMLWIHYHPDLPRHLQRDVEEIALEVEKERQRKRKSEKK